MSCQEGRIGIDIGGTFTDLIYQDKEGCMKAVKVPTTPANPERGCMNAVNKVAIKGMDSISYFLHATTVGLNALLERRGATVGILTTEGFRDTLVIGRGDRAEMYNIKWNPPKPLVARKLRLGIRERMFYNGTVKTPLHREDIIKALDVFNANGVNAIAVVYLHAYANPEHELETLNILREEGFEGKISLSHQVTGEYREYERTTTTVIDAFVSGRMGSYLDRVEKSLKAIGFKGLPLITQSGGGAMTFKDAGGSLSKTILSGPVAGAEGAAELARSLNLGDLITADVGGTSFDTCIIVDGRPKLMYEGKIMGMPVQMPWVDVRSIGAGGGTIAYIDEGGLLRVGPKSSGANPGPACYGKGGGLPTITDAALVLGMLGKGELASGLTLDKSKSISALQSLVDDVGTSVERVAQGILQIATSGMANTIREITIENGIDPRKMKLIAYGGAGPLFSGLIAEELQIKDIVIPPFAGNFSAWGLLGTDIVYSKSLTRKFTLNDGYTAILNPILKNLFGELQGRLSKNITMAHEVALDIRYTGQEHTLTLPIENDMGVVAIKSGEVGHAFEKAYYDIYDANLEVPLEVVAVRVALRKALPKRSFGKQNDLPVKGDIGMIDAYSFCREKFIQFKLMDRAQLVPGKTINGPAILTENTATTYVDEDAFLVLDSSGCIFVAKRD